MKWKNWLNKWNMESLKISIPFLEMKWNPKKADKDAAWELYVELLTRITVQPLPSEDGDEETALQSIYSLFGLTRSIIKSHGLACLEFTKLAVVILNQIVRPFTAKWHKIAVSGKFNDPNVCREFRSELNELQEKLRVYTKMLSDMAGVEDLTNLEESQ